MNSKQVGRWMDDEYIGRVKWMAFGPFDSLRANAAKERVARHPLAKAEGRIEA